MPDYLSDVLSERALLDLPAVYSQEEMMVHGAHCRAEGFKEGMAEAIRLLKEAAK